VFELGQKKSRTIVRLRGHLKTYTSFSAQSAMKTNMAKVKHFF